MKKPIDPRKHGLLEPSPVILETKSVALGSYSPNLLDAMKIWNEIEKSLKQKKYRLRSGPIVCDGTLKYSFEYFNNNYENELATYNQKIAQYDLDMQTWEEGLKRKAAGEKEARKDQIARLERRLANLKAAEEGLPLPYPNHLV